MFGIGPMLPVIPAADNDNCSSRVQKRQSKHVPGTERHDSQIMRRVSTAETERTLFEEGEDCVSTEPPPTPYHQRDLSLIVDFDLEHAAAQLKAGEISDLELALFAFWIKAKDKNYMMAKKLVRELALDQGYNVDKIINVRVRKLLQEVHDIRPSDPRHASSWESPFHSQTRNSFSRRSGSTRTVSSPLAARMDMLPPSLRLKRERIVQEAAQCTMTSNEAVDYPPNTPDRPAPLSVKSRSSQTSSSTPMSSSIPRSASTPVHFQPEGDVEHLYRRRSVLKIHNAEILGHSPTATSQDTCRGTVDVFGCARSTYRSYNTSFTNRLHSSEDRRHGTPGKYMDRDCDGQALGHYQLDASDVASESSCGTFTSFVRKNKGRKSTSILLDGDTIGDESFDALESYVGSEDEYERSILESASNISEEGNPTRYCFSAQAPSPLPVIAGPAPKHSERRAIVEARRRVQEPISSSQAVNFHRPLPLRSYESEASMFPTVGAQACSGRTRSKSVTSMIASSRPAAETLVAPSRMRPSQERTSLDDIEREFYEANILNTKISEKVEPDKKSDSQRSANASTLAAFPIPPMSNPVGELPMLVSRAASSPESLRTASSQHPVASASLEDTYRAIVKVNMTTVLERTRERGKRLQTVDWAKLTSFEQAWREMNKLLLETIFGRNDVALKETDVAYIDCVARELRNDPTELKYSDWVRNMFEAEE